MLRIAITGLSWYFALYGVAVARTPIDPAVLAELQFHGRTRVIIGLDGGALVKSAESVARETGIVRVESIDDRTAAALLTSAAELNRLVTDPRINYIVADRPFRISAATEERYSNVMFAWDFGYDGQDTAIAIVDGPIDDSHPLLRNKVVARACFSVVTPGEVGSACGPDARKLATDEVVSFSDKTASCAGQRAAAPAGGCQHATHVAGIAAGTQIAGVQAVGIAKGADLVIAQVIDGEGKTFLSSVLRALTWITGKVEEQRSTGIGPNIVAVNMSFGGGAYHAHCDNEGQFALVSRRIREMRNDGVAAFAAAGNNGSVEVSFPACLKDVIAVGAVDANQRLTSFSNRDPGLVSVLAFGDGVLSSAPGGGYKSLSGTSMASASAAGAFAVLKSAFPKMNVDQIQTALRESGQRVTTASGETFRAIDVAASYAFLLKLRSEIEEAQRAAAVISDRQR